MSYEVYPLLKKRYKYLEGQSEMIFKFIKDQYRIYSEPDEDGFPVISDAIDKWIEDTYRKYKVNMYNFCYEQMSLFMDHPEKWPKGTKSRAKDYDQYLEFRERGSKIEEVYYLNYDYKTKNNLLGINTLYREIPKKLRR